MTDTNPITPPPELAAIWVAEIYGNGDPAIPLHPITLRLVERAAQWGYDQRSKVNEAELQQARDEELEACCELLKQKGVPAWSLLHTTRRPKPPSLKEQALTELNLTADPKGAELSRTQVELIRRALEALDD